MDLVQLAQLYEQVDSLLSEEAAHDGGDASFVGGSFSQRGQP
jgi:hypothetical protein